MENFRKNKATKRNQVIKSKKETKRERNRLSKIKEC